MVSQDTTWMCGYNISDRFEWIGFSFHEMWPKICWIWFRMIYSKIWNNDTCIGTASCRPHRCLITTICLFLSFCLPLTFSFTFMSHVFSEISVLRYFCVSNITAFGNIFSRFIYWATFSLSPSIICYTSVSVLKGRKLI